MKTIWNFLKVRKKWWLPAVILFIILLAIAVLFAPDSNSQLFDYSR